MDGALRGYGTVLTGWPAVEPNKKKEKEKRKERCFLSPLDRTIAHMAHGAQIALPSAHRRALWSVLKRAA